MADKALVVEFRRGEPRSVLAHIDAIVDRGDGEGWINLGPALTDDEYSAVPHRSGLAAWFSGRGPVVPMATWTPPLSGDRPRAAQIGVSHGTGPNALARLADEGITLPDAWDKKQDHAKHGIVADLPGNVDHSTMIDWLLSVMVRLSPLVDPEDRWIAEVHRPGDITTH